MKKRLPAFLLTAAMLSSLFPLPALAAEVDTEGLCPHHMEHSYELCGFTESAEGCPCSHVHDGDCGFVEAVPEVPCDMDRAETDEDSRIVHAEGCAYAPEVAGASCRHEHDPDCGYSPDTEGTPCGYVCPICPVQDMIDALPEDITAGSRDEAEARLAAIGEAWAELDGQAGNDLPAPLEDHPAEQHPSLTPGDTYWFDLSGAGIPGTVNEGTGFGAVSVPDKTLHWVPFTYAGTINAYSNPRGISISSQVEPYNHRLFIAEYNVTHSASWDNLRGSGLVFGKSYASGGVAYTMRAPSAGSSCTGSDDDERGVPQSNEWDMILNKNAGYIKNWMTIYSWGQDTSSSLTSCRVSRGYRSARYWYSSNAGDRYPSIGFRPVLEAPGDLPSDGLKVVTLDPNGGRIGSETGPVNIVVGDGKEFTAPSGEGLTPPDGNSGNYLMWKGDNGKLYQAGEAVPAGVTELTAQWEPPSLPSGDTYWFDLSKAGIPGTVNKGNLEDTVPVPDASLHWVPFTCTGTINVYNLEDPQATTEEYANNNKYDHSLFIADYSVAYEVSWDDLNGNGMIFGKPYASGGVDYTMRAPSVGSNCTGSDDDERGTPQSNEWDIILNKNVDYIKNWENIYSWGQDTDSTFSDLRAVRGYSSARYWNIYYASGRYATIGFRPVLELPGPDALTSDLKFVTLDLNGGKIGSETGPVNIVAAGGEDFTAPSSEGLTRPAGNDGDYFMWKGGDGRLYQAEEIVPAGVTKLTAVWAEAVAPVITTQPGDQSVSIGQRAAFTAAASGEPSPTYQWQVNKGNGWEVIPGAASSSYTTEAASMGMNGWKYRCAAANSGGTATSNEATLTVQKAAPPAATPQHLNIANHLEKTYSVLLSNLRPQLPAGADWKNVTYELTDVTFTQEGYYEAGTAEIIPGPSGTLNTLSLPILFNDVTTEGRVGTVTVTIRSDNYWNFTNTLEIMARNKETVTFTGVTGVTVSYTGRPMKGYTGELVIKDSGGGTVTPDLEISYTGRLETSYKGTQPPTEAGTYSVIFRVADTDPKYIGRLAVNFEITRAQGGGDGPGNSGGGNGGGTYTPPSTPAYPPTVEKPSEGGGTPAVSPSNPRPGDTVTVKPKPDEGYEVDKVTVTDKNGKPVSVAEKPDGTYTFTQPDGKVKIEMTYQPIDRPWSNPFADVSEGSWYYEAVRFVQEQGLMNGYSDGRFGANDTLARAQLAQILFNKEGRPGADYLLNFSDVAGEAWYAEAVRWAASQGIVGGYGNGTFGPNNPITREQLAVMLWRYSGSPAATSKELHFNDEAEISGFALEALRWAVENGILNGYGDGRLGPQGQATRAQVAQMLKNFIENQEETT